MKMMNKLEKKLGVEKRWDMMVELSKMQRDLDRMYGDLMADGSKDELEGMRGAIANLEYLKININNKRSVV